MVGLTLSPSIRAALADAGQDWSIEHGGKSWKLRMSGRLVAVIGRGAKHEGHRAERNIVAQIRRAAKAPP